MSQPRAKIKTKAQATTIATPSNRGIFSLRNKRSAGVSTKLNRIARARGSSTSRPTYSPLMTMAAMQARFPAAPVSPRALDRTVLPISEPNYPLATELDARNAKAPPRFEVKAPKGLLMS